MVDEHNFINRHLNFYQSLDNGQLKPKTQAQSRFVKVCRGELKPKTEHEVAYMNYKKRKAGKSENVKPPKNITEEQLRFITYNNFNYRKWKKTPQQIQSIRNQVQKDEEWIRKKDAERRMIQNDSGIKCKKCGAPMVWRIRMSVSPAKHFLGCSRYPRCKYIEGGSW